MRNEQDAKQLEIERMRLEKRDGVEQRRKNKEGRAKTEKVLREAAEQAKTEASSQILELQVGRAARRSWMN